MGRGIIEKPLREVAEFIKNAENNMSWDYFLIVSQLQSCIIHNSILLCSLLMSMHCMDIAGSQMSQDHFRDTNQHCIHWYKVLL